MIHFKIEGRAQPQGRPRAVRMGAGVRMYDPPEDIDPKAPSPLEVIVTKNKDGGLGTATLDFYKQIQKIY